MAQPRTARNTAAKRNANTQNAGGTAVAVRPSKSASSARGLMPTHEQICQRAHEIWLKKGRLPGQDEQNWLEAETQLRAEMNGK